MNLEQRVNELEKRIADLEKKATAATAAETVTLNIAVNGEELAKKVMQSINVIHKKEPRQHIII